jgi:hypothetical protein
MLFPADNGNHMQPSTLYRHFYRARDKANRPDLRWHDLRHSGAVLAAQTGATLAELMARLGHSTHQAAMRYQHAAQGRDQAIAAALSVLAGGGNKEAVDDLHPWDASILIYCDDHAAQPLPVIHDPEPPLRDGVYVFGNYQRRTDFAPVPRWVPDIIVADSKADRMVWVHHTGERFLDANSDEIALHGLGPEEQLAALEHARQVGGLGEGDDVLNRRHFVFRHRSCRRNLRLTEAALTAMLDQLAAQGVTGVSVAFLDRLNSQLPKHAR